MTTIRPAEPGDFDEIFNLLKQLWPDLDLDYNSLSKIFMLGIDSDTQRLIVSEVNSAFHPKDAHKFYESTGYQNRAFLFSRELTQ